MEWIHNIHIPPATLLMIAITAVIILQEKELNWSFKTLEIVGILAVYVLWEHCRQLSFTTEVIVYLIISVATGAFFGALRSSTNKIYYSKSRKTTFAKGTWISVLVFIIGFALNTAIKFTFEKLYHDEVAVIAAASVLHVAVSMVSVKAALFYIKNHEKHPTVVE
ncbi:MAG: hypothetical protein QM632_06000 [Micrococcaceae bacterium]